MSGERGDEDDAQHEGDQCDEGRGEHAEGEAKVAGGAGIRLFGFLIGSVGRKSHLLWGEGAEQEHRKNGEQGEPHVAKVRRLIPEALDAARHDGAGDGRPDAGARERDARDGAPALLEPVADVERDDEHRDGGKADAAHDGRDIHHERVWCQGYDYAGYEHKQARNGHDVAHLVPMRNRA